MSLEKLTTIKLVQNIINAVREAQWIKPIKCELSPALINTNQFNADGKQTQIVNNFEQIPTNSLVQKYNGIALEK